MTETAKEFLEEYARYTCCDEKTVHMNHLRQWFFSRQKEIETELNKIVNPSAVITHKKMVMAKAILQSNAWREFCEAIK